MLLRGVKGGGREKTNDENLQQKKSRGEVQWLYVEFHKTARVQFKTRQGNSGHDKFWTRQIQAKTGV